MPNENTKLDNLIAFLEGMAESAKRDSTADKLDEAVKYLQKLNRNMCGQGYCGCHGGPNCGSDHK